MLVKKPRDFAESFLCFGGAIKKLCVGLTFEDFELCVYAGLPQLTVNPHPVAQQQIAGPGRQDRWREAAHISVYRREQRILEIVAVFIDICSGVASAVARHEDV